jgi:outer membrane protein TolC
MQIDAFDRNASSNRWRWAPTVNAFGNVRAFNYPGFAGDNYSWAVGLNLDWLLYDGGVRDANFKLQHAMAEEQRYQLAKLRDTVADDLYNARRGLETKRRALDTAVQSVGLAKETLDLVRVQHDAGTATQLDLLTAQDQLITAEVAVAQARFDLALADLTLRRTAGTFPGH